MYTLHVIFPNSKYEYGPFLGCCQCAEAESLSLVGIESGSWKTRLCEKIMITSIATTKAVSEEDSRGIV